MPGTEVLAPGSCQIEASLPFRLLYSCRDTRPSLMFEIQRERADTDFIGRQPARRFRHPWVKPVRRELQIITIIWPLLNNWTQAARHTSNTKYLHAPVYARGLTGSLAYCFRHYNVGRAIPATSSINTYSPFTGFATWTLTPTS